MTFNNAKTIGILYLGRNIEAVALLGVELGGVKDDCDLSLQHNKHHRVLVRARHALRAVALDPEQIECSFEFLKVYEVFLSISKY